MRKFNIKVDGVVHEVEVEEINDSSVSSVSTASVVSAPKQAVPNQVKKSAGGNSVVAPLQGTVQKIKVKVGDIVNSGDVVAIIEAMKMENDIPANATGKVVAIHVSEGSKVSSGDAILDIA